MASDTSHLNALRTIGLTDQEEKMYEITDEPKIPGYLCFPNDAAKKEFDTDEGVFGQGFDLREKRARVKSIGECLERLCLYNPTEGTILVSGYDKSRKFVDPASFFCYSDEQVPNREKAMAELRGEKYRWVATKDLTTGEDVLVPAQIVFLSKLFDDELQIRKERISTGAALGPRNTGYALKSGLMESVERDATTYSYLKRRNIRRIVGLPVSLRGLVEYFERYNLEPHIFDITTDLGIPTVMVITLDRTGCGAAVNVGSRADLNYRDAIKGAMLESIHCRRQSRVMKEFQFPEKMPEESEITSMDNRFYYWHVLSRIEDLGFWLDTDHKVKYEKLSRKSISFGDALKSLFERGYHVHVVDMTIPKISEGGFEALKVIVPELQPLYLDERAKALFSVHHGVLGDDKRLKPHPFT